MDDLASQVLVLADEGCELRVHADLDWPGLSIATSVLGLPGAGPWRLTAADYLTALRRLDDAEHAAGGRPLTGRAVPTPWDPDLAPTMERLGRIVYEEDVLDVLLADLQRGR